MTEERITYCRICEPLCGMVATVEEGKLVKLRPDKQHPLSKGFACPKGIAFTEVQNDPDRVLRPLRRTGAPGEFEQVSWQEAMADITARLRGVIGEHGREGVGYYFGNPSAFSLSHSLAAPGFMLALGSPHVYSAGSQDVNQRFVASELLYGSPIMAPIPDVERTELLLIVGANPLVSHGSVMSSPRIKHQLHAIVGRGGRVVVVDPRRTETAREFEWMPANPDGDAWLLLSLLQVMFAEGLADERLLAEQSAGWERLRALAAPFAPEETERRHGVGAEEVRELARALAVTERAAVYGRTGTSLGRSATLTTFLLDAVNVVAGNLDREGGSMFGSIGVPGERALGKLAARILPIRTGARRSRIGGFPSVLGTEPATMMAKEITTPGDGQIRALFVSAGNPVLSSPDGEELEAALEELDLMVSLDFYVNETNAHADYVLPATTMYERTDFPLPFLALFTTPFVQATETVVEPAGEAREEWEVIAEVARGIWRASPALTALELGRRALGPLYDRLADPMRIADAVVRLGKGGDRFGLRRGGLNLSKLLDRPSGVKLADNLQAGVLREVVWHDDRKVRLDPPEIVESIGTLEERPVDSEFPLMLIGMRELRSENSWMHNTELLNRGGRLHGARIHPEDAGALGIDDGALIRIASRHGEIELPAIVSEEMKPGVLAVPHGWGHKGSGGWTRANAAGAEAKGNGNGKVEKAGGNGAKGAANGTLGRGNGARAAANDGRGNGAGPAHGPRPGGVNVNQLMSTDPAHVESLAGMAHLNGVPIRVEGVEGAEVEQDLERASSR